VFTCFEAAGRKQAMLEAISKIQLIFLLVFHHYPSLLFATHDPICPSKSASSDGKIPNKNWYNYFLDSFNCLIGSFQMHDYVPVICPLAPGLSGESVLHLKRGWWWVVGIRWCCWEAGGIFRVEN